METHPHIDEYGLQYLTYHLFRTGNARKLYELVSSNTWFSASSHFDLSHGRYNQDVDYALQTGYSSIQSGLENNVGSYLITRR